MINKNRNGELHMLSKYASEIIKILVHQDDKFITNTQIAKC